MPLGAHRADLGSDWLARLWSSQQLTSPADQLRYRLCLSFHTVNQGHSHTHFSELI